MYAFCYAKTKDCKASEEIVHDVFIAPWKRREKFVFSKKTENYLMISARTKIVDFYRKKANTQTSTWTACNLCEENGFDASAVEHNLAVHRFLKQDLQLVVDQLPCRCQEVYRLSREEHLTIEEIAIRLGISQKTVKNHLTKALSFINKHLKANR
ncbi:MAG: sigma-70 family RNA polymerase sigma factor [Cytophagales bacterium]|nr:sigma-70 family RNA polymerase sigma factor [Cytophagales bacterium]